MQRKSQFAHDEDVFDHSLLPDPKFSDVQAMKHRTITSSKKKKKKRKKNRRRRRGGVGGDGGGVQRVPPSPGLYLFRRAMSDDVDVEKKKKKLCRTPTCTDQAASKCANGRCGACCEIGGRRGSWSCKHHNVRPPTFVPVPAAAPSGQNINLYSQMR